MNLFILGSQCGEIFHRASEYKYFIGFQKYYKPCEIFTIPLKYFIKPQKYFQLLEIFKKGL